MTSSLHDDEVIEVPVVEAQGTFAFQSDLQGVRLAVSWVSKQQGIICDLDLNAFFYDERARFCGKVDASTRLSKDGSCQLIKDDDHRAHCEFVKIDFNLVGPETSAIVLFLDGGPRNFQFLQSVSMECTRVFAERSFNSFLPQSVDETNKHTPLFQSSGRTRKAYKGLCMGVLYKEGWDAAHQSANWVMRVFLEPVYVSSIKDKQDKCTALVIGAVPSLEKFRPRLFSSIREICAALSSHALPKLKKKFQRTEDGLHIGQFTEVIFKQLHETHPRILDDTEAPYAVAMLQEMFQQIDYNGDGSTNWDEFTTFCVQTGLGSKGDGYSLDQYVIEYGEEVLHRDHVLSAYRFVAVMRHIPEERKLLIIPEDADNVLVMDEKFRLLAQLYPSKVQVVGSLTKKDSQQKRLPNGPTLVYDAVYCSGRDLIAYCASDHSITVCKQQSTVQGMKVKFVQHNRFYHNLLHLKLCWSGKHDLLCSTASDRVIYGWNIDTAQIIFQISRHSDIITDFIAVDALDIFITCSMDRRIVMWSAISRRVKGVLLGHRRGVRSLSVYENTLLSAGFECEAKTWDLASKDCVSILKGHRQPIVAAKLMCDKATTEKEHRAITVDESGEFRVWNIYVRERTTDPVPATTMQIFTMQNPESPLNQFRFLALPYNQRSSTSYYSNLIACSTKLFHFIPEKNTKEFIPPTAFVCHESGAALITAIGKTVLMYDLASGQFEQVFERIASHDIFAICMDGERGRRMFVGTSSGEVLLVNSINGQVIDSVQYHSKEVTCIIQRKGTRTALFSCSMDGNLRVYEEGNGKIHLQNSVDQLFGEGVGLTKLKLAHSVQTLVAVSAGKVWGLLNDSTLKKTLIVHEADVITAIEVVGASRDKMEEDMIANNKPVMTTMKESFLTLAVAMTKGISVYVLDMQDLRGVKTYDLHHAYPIYITDLMVMRTGNQRSVNYSSIRAGKAYEAGTQQLIATTDDGKIVVWDLAGLRQQGEDKFRAHFHAPSRASRKHRKKEDASPSPSPTRSTMVSESSARAAFLTGVDEKAAPVTSWVETSSKDFFPVTLGTSKTRRSLTGDIVMSDNTWTAHGDTIPTIIILQSHGCFVTVSHDGYHRVWNMDAELLGEMTLPNITEQMKQTSMCKEPGSQWRFILERIPITKHHLDIANVLIRSIKQSRQEKMIEHERSKHFVPFGFKGIELREEEEETPKDKYRRGVLKSLTEAPKFAEEPPPTRLPTKEEKDLIRVAYGITDSPLKSLSASDSLSPMRSPSTLSPLNERSVASTLASMSSPAKSDMSALRSSLLFNGDSSVCLSSFGVPSLWYVPGEKDIFGKVVSPSKQELPPITAPPAFSESSISSLLREGMIDAEGHRILKSIASKSDRVQAYDRSVATLLIRSPSISTNMKLPALEGDMYKNAEKLMNDKESAGSMSKGAIRNAVAQARVETSVRRIHSMVHVIQPPTHDEVILPKASGEDEDNHNRTDEAKMAIRLMKSAAAVPMEAAVNQRALDRKSIDKWITKMTTAMDTTLDGKMREGPKSPKKTKEVLSQAAIIALEGKLYQAIRGEFRNRMAIATKRKQAAAAAAAAAQKLIPLPDDEATNDSAAVVVNVPTRKDSMTKDLPPHMAGMFQDLVDEGEPEAPKGPPTAAGPHRRKSMLLTTRMLLPYYKLESVHQFMDIFAKVDENFSGDLDVDEWIRLFTSLNETIPVQEARMIFLKIDKDGDGYITMRELVPVVFSKASREQLKLIIHYTELELTKKIVTETVPKVTATELEFLFEAYDMNNVGFVDIAHIRDRVRTFGLTEQQLYFFMEIICEMADDDMVNLTEFKRMFVPFTAARRRAE